MVLTMTPQPISSVPQDHDKPFLLYCPEQGGWHIGIWFLGKWLAYIDTSTVLQPSHWSPVPPDPPDVEDPPLPSASRRDAARQQVRRNFSFGWE
jgi:hypothetical protein